MNSFTATVKVVVEAQDAETAERVIGNRLLGEINRVNGNTVESFDVTSITKN